MPPRCVVAISPCRTESLQVAERMKIDSKVNRIREVTVSSKVREDGDADPGGLNVEAKTRAVSISVQRRITESGKQIAFHPT